MIPEGCEVIGYGAFSGCKNLSILVLPSTLEVLGGSAFRHCKSLQRVCIPSKKLRRLDLSAFSYCYKLERVETMFGTYHFDREDCPMFDSDGYEQDIGLDEMTFETGGLEIYRKGCL